MDRSSPYRGLILSLSLLAIIFGSFARASALVGLGLAWLALLALARVLAWRDVRLVEASRKLPAGAVEGDIVSVDVTVENHDERPARFIVVSDSFGAGASDQQDVLEIGPLPAHHRRLVSYRAFVARQWGSYTVGPLTIGAWDPLGLCWADKKLPLVDTFEVFPRPVELEDLVGVGALPTAAPRGPTEKAAGQSLLFRGVRGFRSGDDVRRIHWPATARHGSPMVRECERDVEPMFTIVLDLDRKGRGGIGRQSTLEQLVRTATTLLFAAHRQGDAIQIVGHGDKPFIVPVGRGSGHLAGSLHALVHVRQNGSMALPQVIDTYRELLPPGTTAAVLGANMEVDDGDLGMALRSLHAANVACMGIFVDSLSFTPVDRPPVLAATIVQRRTIIEECFASVGMPLVLLRCDAIPEVVLDRATLAPAEGRC